MKRGRGGRSSFSGDVVTVFGANGFIGRAVSNRLGKNGSQMIFPYRGEHYKMMKMKTVGDLGQVLFTPFQLTDDDSIRRAVAHSNIVINLTGRGFETRNFRYEDVNIEGPARIARICQEMGVKRLVHMSHINAREEPETIFLSGGSRFLATKWQGEQAVRAEFPGVTIFRPSDVYGQGDSFLNYYFTKHRRSKYSQGAISLYAKGELTAKQPIFMSDIATGIINSLHDPSAVGQTYEAMGPQRMTQADLLTYLFDCATRNKEQGNFDIKELMFDPRTLIKHFIYGKMGKMGNQHVFVSASLDRLER
jgi:NADH dehydrogenase (ubiquinone) 1 alpha subcomplex subunit 9